MPESNSAKMSLEEKVVQMMKDETIFKLIEDEDAITDLAKRAVTEAFFQPRRVGDRSRSWEVKEVDSPAVEAARDAAKKIGDQIVIEIMEDPEMKKRIKAMVIDMIPAIIGMAVYENFHSNMKHSAENIMFQFREEMKSAGQG